MSEIREKINEINRAAKKSRRINNILWLCVVGLVGLSFYFAYSASNSEARAVVEKEKALRLAHVNDSLMLEAQQSRQKIVDVIKEADLELWDQAKAANSIDSYAFYLKVTEGKQRSDEIKTAIETLFKDEGYVQLIDSDGSTEYFKEKLNSDLGHFLIASADRNVNTGVIGNADFPRAGDKRGHSIKKGQVVKVLQEFKSGNAVWAKIGYKIN